MLNLALATDKLQLTTSSAADISVHASFVDYVQSPESATPGKQNTAIAAAATTDIVAAPAASTFRNVKFLSFRNKHASTANDVTVIFDASGTDYELIKCTLLAGESLVCREGVWFHFDANGGVYGAQLGLVTDSRLTVRKLTAQHSISATAATEVTDLEIANLLPGTYVFDYYLIVRSATATVSPMFGVNFTGTAAVRKMTLTYPSTGTTASSGTADDVSATSGQLSETCTVTAFVTTAPNMGHTGGVATINADIYEHIEGIMVVTVAGNLEFWHGSETATATSVEAGSSLVCIKVA